jgi:threonine synthase
MTPLYRFPRLAERCGVEKLFIKEDSQNPSLSCKDRASLISILKAQELGFSTITTASTGNAAASLACLSASLGAHCIIFVPKSIPQAKLVQVKIHGAKVVLVEGNYDSAFNLCRQVADQNKWYNRSTAINPYNLEGKKTVAYEICEQMGYKVPDYIFVPVGDGCIISGVWKGFTEFLQLNLIDHLPRLIACQAAGSDSIYQSFKNGLNRPITVASNTIADSISVDLPRDGVKALRALNESNGDVITLSDEEILAAMAQLAEFTGILTEPSSAAAFAGFTKYHQGGNIKPSAGIVILLTGSGLKDVAAAQRATKAARQITINPQEKGLAQKLASL